MGKVLLYRTHYDFRESCIWRSRRWIASSASRRNPEDSTAPSWCSNDWHERRPVLEHHALQRFEVKLEFADLFLLGEEEFVNVFSSSYVVLAG